MKKYWAGQGTLTDDTPVEIKAAVTGRVHYVTKVVLVITTHANAKTVRVQDDAGTPVVAWKHHDLTKAAGVPDVVETNFGRRGMALTVSKAVDICGDAATGVAGKVYVEGYTL